MKTLNSIRYILFACLIIGLFANFAQNGYSGSITFSSTFLLALVSLAMIFGYSKKIWKQNKSSAIFLLIFILGWVLLILLIPLINNISIIERNGETIALSIFFLIAGATLAELIWVIIENWKKPEPSDKFLAMENIGLFFIFLGYAFKLYHWPGASFMLMFSLPVFLFLYLFKAFKQLFSELRNGKIIAILSFLFYFDIVVGVIGYVFKWQHWPFTAILLRLTTIIFIVIIIPLLLNTKFHYDTAKMSFGKYLRKNSPIFAFIYVNYVALVIVLQMMNIGPKMISGFPYVYQKMLDGTYAPGQKSTGTSKQDAYWNNYVEFMDARRNTTENQ